MSVVFLLAGHSLAALIKSKSGMIPLDIVRHGIPTTGLKRLRSAEVES